MYRMRHGSFYLLAYIAVQIAALQDYPLKLLIPCIIEENLPGQLGSCLEATWRLQGS